MVNVICFIAYKKHRKICIINSKHVKKKGKRKIKPEIQGDLDGLCGVYSVINAVRVVCKRKQVNKEHLFKHLLQTLDMHTPVREAMLTGTYKKHIDHMLNAAKTFLDKKNSVKIAIEPLFKRGSKVSVTSYWKTLQSFLRGPKRRCVIVGYHGRHDHWTVIYDITDDVLKLLDSGGTKRIRRQACQVGKPYNDKYYHLVPTQVWGIALDQ